MTKPISLLLITLVAFSALASKDKKGKTSDAPAKTERKIAQLESETPHANVFAGFLGCRSLLAQGTPSLAKFESCVDIHAVSAAARKRSLMRFLATPVEVSRIRDCREADITRAKGFSDITEYVICFDYTDGQRKGVGLAYFLKHAGKFRVFSLQSLSDF